MLEGNTTQQLRFLSQIANHIGTLIKSDGSDGNKSEKEEQVDKEKDVTQVIEQTIGMESSPIIVPTEKMVKNFKEAFLGCSKKRSQKEDGINRCMRPLAVPRYEGGNLVIDLGVPRYVEELKYRVVGRLFLTKVVLCQP